jgi:hypothetical protein
VLGTAAALAAIAVWFAMRDDRPSPDRSGDPAPRAAEVQAAAKPIEPSPAPVAPEPAQPPAAPAPARTDPEPAQPPPAQIATEARGAPRLPGERSPTPVALSSPAAPPRRAPPSTLRTGSPPTAPTGAMGPTSATGPTASNAPRTWPIKALAAQYDRGDYWGDFRTALRACSAALVSAEIARLCLHAACAERDPLEARRWFSAPGAESELTYCRSRSIGPGTSTLDCRHNPLDCR